MEYIDKKINSRPGGEQLAAKYLNSEKGWKGISFTEMPHYQPSVPIQKNTTDCGLYLLENAESFLRDPEFIL